MLLDMGKLYEWSIIKLLKRFHEIRSSLIWKFKPFLNLLEIYGREFLLNVLRVFLAIWLGAFYDLGTSIYNWKTSYWYGIRNLYSLNFQESKSCSIRGIKVDVKNLDQSVKRTWSHIKKLILKSKLDKFLQKKIYKVFESLA